MPDSPTLVTVAVCTRDRPADLAVTLDALQREAPAGLELLVIDQSPQPDAALAGRAGVRVIRDDGRGLSRARNVALAATEAEWIAFIDDDCTVAEGFGAALVDQLRGADGVDWVSGNVGSGHDDGSDLPVVTTFPVDLTRTRTGRWVLPGSIGFGVMFVVRCATARRLGGWDERLGPGVEPFPAADDMDFNHRLLRSGASALLTPALQATHRQWRTPAELIRLNQGYLRAWTGFAGKQARTGHPLVALWLLGWGLVDIADMAGSAIRARSGIRARLALSKARGWIEGTVKGLARRW